jgi:isoaspartyl peptidase/L-asparaginase-like protein (Ntn-hydrolase superfamily)
MGPINPKNMTPECEATYRNANCGAFATGWGAYFIRQAVAHNIRALMRHANLLLDRHGNISMTFNTSGMYRGTSLERARVKRLFARMRSKDILKA